MEAVAVIAEFNPFHNGHARLFTRIRERTGEETAIAAVMSGCFTQRGEPALLDKWTRTQAALACGADLVIELPFAYAAAGAGRFAAGGVALADATGVCRTLAFGSETGDLGVLDATARLLVREPPEFRDRLRARLDLGEPFAGARIAALEEYLAAAAPAPEDGCDAAPDASCLRTSNNILAVEYLAALRRTGSPMVPMAVLREGADDRDHDIGAAIASATAIRAAVRTCRQDPAGAFQAVRPQMPAQSVALLVSAMLAGEAPVLPEDLAGTAITMLRSLPPAVLASFAGMEEGLSARLAAAAARPASDDPARSPALLDDLLEAAATRRFASTRIRRAVAAMLAGLTREDLALFDRDGGGPRYLRVLGFTRRGRRLLRIMRGRARLPIMMNASDFLEYGNDAALTRMAALDRVSTDLWMLARGFPCGRDFDTPPIMV
ncbi:MAG: nucleotidyltransferase family protein [Clostridia bacterium]|nr:nucleotidyltransferase family protein [Clostridia bacterium]